MNREQQILFILKEASKPIKAREIAKMFELHFNEAITKKEVSSILTYKLKNEVKYSSFPFYTYSLLKEEIQIKDANKEVVTKVKKQQSTAHIPESDNSDRGYLDILKEYSEIFYKIRSIVTKPQETQSNYKEEIEILKGALLTKKEELIDFIIENNIDIDEVSAYLAKEELIHKQILGDERIQEYYRTKLSDTEETNTSEADINEKIQKLINQYEKSYSDLIILERKPKNIQITFKTLIDDIKSKLDIVFEEIILIILDDDISLSSLEDACSRYLYVKIENHDKIYRWVQSKEKSHQLEEESYEDKLKEFKILCQKVWEDGIVDEDEQIEINDRIKVLGLDNKDANEIFEQIKGEYLELHLLDKLDISSEENNIHDCFDDVISIDNKTFHFKMIDQPMSPLFWHKYENGFEIIYINTNHNQFSSFNLDQLKKILVSICRTKLSFTNKEGQVFENRFKNYLNLI